MAGNCRNVWKRAADCGLLTGAKISARLIIRRTKKEVKALENAFRKFGGYTDSNYCMSGGTYARALPQAFAFGMAMPEKKSSILSFPSEGTTTSLTNH